MLNSVPVELYSNWITYLYNRNHRNHPVVGGSDTHFVTMLGQTYTWFAGETSDDFRQSLLNRKVKPGGSVHGPKLIAELAAYFAKEKRLPNRRTRDHSSRRQPSELVVEVEEIRQAPIVVIHCAGQIICDNVEILKIELLRLLQGGVVKVVVDLTDTTFIDSAGLGAIINFQKQIKKTCGNLVITNAAQNVALTFQLVRLDKILQIHSTVQGVIDCLVAEPNKSLCT